MRNANSLCVGFLTSSDQKKKAANTVMRRIMTFRSTTDLIYDGGPIRLKYYNIL